MEKYKPSNEEVAKAEEMMTEEQKRMSEQREKGSSGLTLQSKVLEVIGSGIKDDSYGEGDVVLGEMGNTALYKKMRETLKGSGLKWSPYYSSDRSSTEEITEYFKKEKIDDPEVQTAVILLMSHNAGEIVERLESEKYKGFREGDLDPKKSRIGQIMSQFSVDPDKHLRIDDVDINYRSYSRASVYAKADPELKAIFEYVRKHGDEAMQKELDEFLGEALKRMEEREKKSDLRAKEEEVKKENKIKSITGDIEVSPVTREIIEKNLDPYSGGVKVIDKDTVVVWEERHEHAGSSGIAMSSDIAVYRNGHKQTKTFKFRDAYNPSADNFGNRISGIKSSEIVDKENETEVKIITDGPGSVMFTFSKEAPASPLETLTNEEQEKFKTIFDSKIQELMQKFSTMWESTPTMETPTGHTRYATPRIKMQELVTEIGIGVVQIERQIDARGGYDNPQFMNQLFLIDKDGNIKDVAEAHGYKSENKGTLSLVGINKIDRKIEYSVDGKLGAVSF